MSKAPNRSMKALKVALVILGICCLVACFWYRSGEAEMEDGTRKWIAVGLKVSPWYTDEKVTRPDGNLASSNSGVNLWSLTTLVGIAALGCFKLAGKIRSAQSPDEHLHKKDEL